MADRLDESARALNRIYETLARADEAVGSAPDGAPDAAVMADFRAAMDDDLNTARAIGVVFETVRAIYRQMTGNEPPAR